MTAWFSKVFNTPPPEQTTAPATPLVADLDDLDDEELPRRVIQAPLLVDAAEKSGWSDTIRIKARLDSRVNTAIFMVDRPVLDRYSYCCPDAEAAEAHSPLAAALFRLTGVESVVLHGMTITVTRNPGAAEDMEAFARTAGAEIRAHLQSGMPVLNPDYLERMPAEETIREAVQRVIDEQINPGIAGHSGYITLNRVDGNTLYITMGGGCQGCAASSITLRGGVEREFREAMPFVGAILDETDHAAGTNPYFDALPMGMEA